LIASALVIALRLRSCGQPLARVDGQIRKLIDKSQHAVSSGGAKSASGTFIKRKKRK